MKYQPFERTVRMAIHASLAAENYQRAADFSVTYLNRWPDHEVISEIEYRLRNGQEIEKLIRLFDDK